MWVQGFFSGEWSCLNSLGDALEELPGSHALLAQLVHYIYYAMKVPRPARRARLASLLLNCGWTASRAFHRKQSGTSYCPAPTLPCSEPSLFC